MIGKFRKDDPTPLDAPIARLLSEMDTYGPDSPEYPEQLAYLERLHTLKTGNSRPRVSPDTAAIVLGNLAAVLIVVAYEQKNVMTSKALGFLLKKNP